MANKKKLNMFQKANSAVVYGNSKKYREEGEMNPGMLTDLDFERQAALDAAGMDAPVYGLFGRLWKFYNERMPKKEAHQVNKTVYIWLMILLGWMGGHRYYEKRYVLAGLYTALCWTGLPLAMCVIDMLIAIPIKKDNRGLIWI